MSKRLPYQVTRRGLLAVTTAFIISLCLFGCGFGCFEAPAQRALAMGVPVSATSSGSWWAIFAGASFMGGALGAVIGQVFRDERGGAASMGAFVGALAGPPIMVIFFFAFLIFICMWFGWPT